MVSDDAVRHIHVVLILIADLASVRAGLGLLLDGAEDMLEEICIVVAALVHQHRCHPLKTHTSIHALGWQLSQRTILFAVELHEDIVPDLEHIRVVHVDQVGRVTSPDAVVVDLGARAAGSGITHLPEVVLHVEGQDPRLWQILLPDRLGLLVDGHVGLLRVTAIVRGIESVGVDLVDLGQQLPGPVDRLHLEVVTERPVAKHFKEGVVVDILAHILQIVVLTTGADALLRVHSAL
mmetsp:Transcript_40179/g.87808  ORF Transcript_40179/g.87808 Transcript_40179/m.87808 type:complete len:236 (+) Transcript_40179:2656-3363(+)